MPAAATMETPATVEAAAAMEATATTVELSASMEVTTATITVAAVEVSAAIAAIESASETASAVVAISTTVIAAPVAVPMIAVVAAIPGTGADEDAAAEPIRSVESVGRAGVWVVVVVAVGAHGSRPVIHGTSYTDAKGDALGVRARRREETNSETNGE